MDWRVWDLNSTSCPQEIKGQPEKKKKNHAPYFEVTEGHLENHLVYPLRRVDLEVT